MILIAGWGCVFDDVTLTYYLDFNSTVQTSIVFHFAASPSLPVSVFVL